MLRNRIVAGRSSAAAVVFFLVFSCVLCSNTVSAANQKFIYRFQDGPVNCTNNWPDGVLCTNPPRAPMNTAGLGDFRHSNIISFAGDGNYVLGFQKATSGSWYLAIYPFDSSTGVAGESIWHAREPQPSGVFLQVPGNPSLIFKKDGNLEMWSRGQLRWTLGLEDLGVTHLEFNVRSEVPSEAGNLVLYNRKKHVVWQSKPRDRLNSWVFYSQFTPNFVYTLRREGLQCNPCMGEIPTLGDRRHRNIISDAGNGKYAFGFEETSGGFYLSIYKFNPSDNSAGRPIWRARSKVGSWVKVGYGATITFRPGTIELKNSRGGLEWTTGTIGFGYWYNFYFDTGNLVLVSDQDATVWESKVSNGYGI